MSDLKVALFLLVVAVLFVLTLLGIHSLFAAPEYLDTIPPR